MGLLSNKISRDQLKAGDHIYSWRSYIYSHHGIYVGNGEVIHFTRGGGAEIGTGTFLDRIIVSSVPNHGRENPCLNCGDQSALDGVISSCLHCFLAGGKLYLFEYGVSKATFLAKQRGGTCTTALSDPPEEVIFRARFLLRKTGFGDYDLLRNNCEDFAIYCKTGLLALSVTKLGSSGQANSVCAASDFVSFTLNALRAGKSGQAASMASAASNVLSATLGLAVTGFGPMVLATYCKYSMARFRSDIGVRNDIVKVPVERLAALMSVMEGGSEEGEGDSRWSKNPVKEETQGEKIVQNRENAARDSVTAVETRTRDQWIKKRAGEEGREVKGPGRPKGGQGSYRNKRHGWSSTRVNATMVWVKKGENDGGAGV